MSVEAHVLEVPRDQPLERPRVVDEDLRDPGRGQVTLAVERFGVSSNNLTYALLGHVLGHWAPFPAAAGWGRVPAWGLATVVAGDAEVAPVGARFTGYLPMATHVRMTAVADHPGLRDVSHEREGMLPLYRELRRVDADPTWDETIVDAEVAMLPVYPAAGVLDDDLLRAGVRRVVVSSASSRTSMAVGRLLVERGVAVTGLSGPTRVQAAASVGAYTQVLPYDGLADLEVQDDTTFLDVAGDPSIARAVVDRLGPALSQMIAVGGSHRPRLGGPPSPGQPQPGPPVVRFNTGQRQVDLAEQIGRAAVDQIEQRARRVLVPWAARSLPVEHLHGLAQAADAWTRLGSGNVDALTVLMITP